MNFRSNLFFYLKILLSFLFTYIGLYFFFIGYNEIKYLDLNQPIFNKNFNIFNNDSDINESNNLESIPLISEYESELKNNKKLDIKKDTKEILINVKKNDTFGNILNLYIKDNKLKNEIINLVNKEYNLKNLKIGQKIYFYINKETLLEKIIIPMDFSFDLVVSILDEKPNIKKEKLEISKEINANQFLIKSSLYEDGKKAQIPVSIISEAVRLLSFDVDFQRDIQKDNKLEISYEVFFNENRRTISYGKIKYIKLSFKKNNLEYFFFQTDDGYLNYFNREGKNAQKALMKTPIDGAKLSSSFGMRKHPILGYNKLHKGLDFAAPKGTPIYAAGNGVIEFVGRNGGYGKYIRIRHNGSYKTAYAHLNSYNKNIYKGLRVNQGDIIGFVGSTGRSTGPHLHYEVIYQGEQINPKKMNLPSGKILQGKELERFIKEMNIIYSNFLYSLYE